MQWEARSQSCGLRSHTVVIAPQELITQQEPGFVTPAGSAHCTVPTAHCPTARAVSRVWPPFSRTAFTCQYSRSRTKTPPPLGQYSPIFAPRPIQARSSGPLHIDPRITRIQEQYSNHTMSYYDIDAILTDAEVRTTLPCLSAVVVGISPIYTAAANPYSSPSRKSPASSTSKSPTSATSTTARASPSKPARSWPSPCGSPRCSPSQTPPAAPRTTTPSPS